MSATCQACTAPSPDAWLCGQCCVELRGLLADLPWWINRVAESATGQAKLGDAARHTRAHDAPMRTNSRASRLLDDIRNTLTTILRDILETRGAELPASVSTAARNGSNDIDVLTAMARWLSGQLSAISASEDAGQFHADITRLIRAAERVVNRPVPPRFCGVCTTLHADGCQCRDHSKDGKDCGLALYARRDAIEVTCPADGTLYNIEALFNTTINRADHMRWTREELIGNQRTDSPERYTTGIMGQLDEFVHYKKFQRWVKDRKLRASGYRRADGGIGISRRGDGDEPLYRLSDVRKTRRVAQEAEVKAG